MSIENEHWRIVAYQDGLPLSPRFRDASRQAKVNALREPHMGVILQSASGAEMPAFLPSVLRPSGEAFKGEL